MHNDDFAFPAFPAFGPHAGIASCSTKGKHPQYVMVRNETKQQTSQRGGYHIFDTNLCWLAACEDAFSHTFSSCPPHYFCVFTCGRIVNGMNYNPEITVCPLQEQFKASCIQISAIAKVTSETQTIQTIYKIKVHDT